MITSHTSMREQNVHIVLSEIINKPEVSRADISKNTKLNKATVSEIVRELITNKYVIETGIGSGSSAGGRKPILLKINKHAGISLSFDIRYDKISYMINFLNGEMIEQLSKNVKITKNNVVDEISTIVKEVNKHNLATPFGIIGIAISIHGIISNNKIIFTPNYNIDQLDLAAQIKAALDIPVYIENEANLAALAEASIDNGYKNLVTCSIHTGVGAGIIIDEQLYRGHNGRSGEIGHTTLYPDGVKCPCGNKGCFEQYCSETALLNSYQKEKQNEELSINDLINDYNNHDKMSQELVNQFSKNLSIGLINIMGLFGPEIIYINSPLVNQLPIIIDLVRSNLDGTIFNKIPIALSQIHNHPSLIGATVMNIQNFLNVDAIKVNILNDDKITND